jgi:hypothetical protein
MGAELRLLKGQQCYFCNTGMLMGACNRSHVPEHCHTHYGGLDTWNSYLSVAVMDQRNVT